MSLLLPLLAACGGAGPYGYDREYVPLGDEEPYLEVERRATYEEVRRDPRGFRSQTLGWFGVVTGVEGSDPARVHLQLRAHQERHLCSDQYDSSCRVTVSERDLGSFTAVVDIRPEDRTGQDRLWTGSLVKVYGSTTGELDDEGGPVLRAEWYRHWPRGKYVTTGASRSMRR